ncbi:MAG: MBL fold metallo-hydrolase, partial [Propionibacteriaceae bacterium]|nr:MBL fold metallo-hydrolase [Propionibacteriaceae bacterium]
MKLAPGLHRVGNDIVACYVVADEDGLTLVDAGISGQWPELISELAAMGRSLS